MGHTNNCTYCSHEFKYKYPYRYWSQIALLLYERSVKRMGATESITFMYDNRKFVISDNMSGYGECNGYYSISLVEPMTVEEAENKHASSTYYWPKKLYPIDRDLKILQKISKIDSGRDLDIDVYDVFGDGLHHHCGIIRVDGDEHVKIWLKEAWNHD